MNTGYSKDRSLSKITGKELSVYFSCLSGETLNVAFKSRREFPIEVQPINRTSSYLSFCYGRVLTEELNKTLLKEIFKASNANIDVIEDEDSFILQYKDHKPLMISKKDGKFYSWHEGMEQEARIIWEILRKYGYIENPHRKKISKKKYTIQFKEDRNLI